MGNKGGGWGGCRETMPSLGTKRTEYVGGKWEGRIRGRGEREGGYEP